MRRNVFVDLGFAEREAVEHALRVEIAVRLQQLIRHRQWTVCQGARRWDVPESLVRHAPASAGITLISG